MLDHKGFDLWADGYDKTVGLSEESNTYPFAGYKNVLGTIYSGVRAANARRVLDIGCGTAVLTSRLYADGLDVTAADFSDRMLEISARTRCPKRISSARIFRRAFLRCWRKKSLTPSSAPMRCTT